VTCFNYCATFEESISFLEELCREGFQVVAVPGLFDAPDAPVFRLPLLSEAVQG
jgi:hypothetical protein